MQLRPTPATMKSLAAIVFRSAVALLSGALFITPLRSTAAETIVDNERGFTLRLPDGFQPYPDLVGATPNIIHAFVSGDPSDSELDIILFVEKMAGVIGRERLKPGDLPPGFHGRLFTAVWQGFEVDGFEVPEQLGEISTITYNVQIPLQRAAIQVKLFGPTARESELKPLLSQILGGLTGESNWNSSAVSDTASDNRRFVLMAMAVAIIVGGLVALFLISKKTPKGTVLAIAAVIYFVSWSVDGHFRETLVLRGSLRMLGFAGGILGIIDLVRKRRPQAKSPNVAPTNRPVDAIVVEGSAGRAREEDDE